MEFARPEYLVDPAWLVEHLDDPNVRILDVSTRLTADLHNTALERCVEIERVPNSVFFDVGSGHGVLSATDATLPWMWPSVDQVRGAMRAAGVCTGDRVVLVGRTPRPGIDEGTMWCTRAWWTLHHMGVNVAILHGGMERWLAEGHPVASGPLPATPMGDIEITADGLTARADAADVTDALTAQTSCVIDALSADNFAGIDPGYGPRRGHITGAVNLPSTQLFAGPTAAFHGAATIHRHLADAGLFDREQVITYCGGAIAATVVAFALALFDHPSVQVYDGSLMEWSRDPSLSMTNPSAD